MEITYSYGNNLIIMEITILIMEIILVALSSTLQASSYGINMLVDPNNHGNNRIDHGNNHIIMKITI